MYKRLLALAALCLTANQATACGPETPCLLGDRHYRAYVPEGLDAPKGALVFAHGFRGSDEGTNGNKNLRKLAQERGLVLIAPKSKGVDWALPFSPRDYETDGHAEEAYYEAMLKDAATRFSFDPAQVVMSGFSAGGMVTWHMACNRPDLFAGFVPLSGTFWLQTPQSCADPLKPLIHIHGTEDKVVPLSGRKIRNTHQGDVAQAIELYAREGQFSVSAQTEMKDLSCAERNDPNDQPLTFCTFPGGHRFSMAHLNYALDQM